jgi:uncharacterized membrane protein
MNKYFTTGLAMLLPIVLTVLIITIAVNFLTHPFLEIVETFIKKSGIFQKALFFGKSTFLITLISKVIILIFLCGFIMLIGLLGKLLILDRLFRLNDNFFKQIPYVNKLYKASQEVVRCLFSTSSTSFTQVVYVPFPQKGKLSLGFVTCDAVNIDRLDQNRQTLVSVFVPGTPNPTGGCLFLVKREQLLVADMKVDEAMRFIVSCGMTVPETTA